MDGSSLLAGNIAMGTKARLPGFAFFSTGTDIGLGRRLTLAVDYLGQELINAPRIESGTYDVNNANDAGCRELRLTWPVAEPPFPDD